MVASMGKRPFALACGVKGVIADDSSAAIPGRAGP